MCVRITKEIQIEFKKKIFFLINHESDREKEEEQWREIQLFHQYQREVTAISIKY